MTVIVGITDGDKVYMGSDSMISGENDKQSLKTPKIIKKECIKGCGIEDEVNNMLIGVCGTLRGLQLLQYQWESPIQSQDQIDENYIYVSVLNSIRSLFIEHGSGVILDNQDQQPDYFLIGYKEHLYLLESNYQIYEVDKPYAAIGSGAHYALGTLHLLYDKFVERPNYFIRKSISSAIEFCPTCGGEIKIYCT